ncbi:MAG: FG-GAP-like repeat-containing protein [Balneolales bacterium]|nr:FG-GAP-like repeat-containing protein [Balneolales bacterium]
MKSLSTPSSEIFSNFAAHLSRHFYTARHLLLLLLLGAGAGFLFTDSAVGQISIGAEFDERGAPVENNFIPGPNARFGYNMAHGEDFRMYQTKTVDVNIQSSGSSGSVEIFLVHSYIGTYDRSYVRTLNFYQVPTYDFSEHGFYVGTEHLGYSIAYSEVSDLALVTTLAMLDENFERTIPNSVYFFFPQGPGDVRQRRLTSPEINDAYGAALDITPGGTRIAVGATYYIPEDLELIGAHPVAAPGRVYLYSGSITDQPATRQNLVRTLTGPETGDRFGSQVKISNDGQYVFISAPNLNNGTGAVFIYGWDGTLLQQLNGTAAGSQFGHSIDISPDGEILAVGAPKGASDRGQVLLYKKEADSFILSEDGFTGIDTGDRLGNKVTFNQNGDLLAVAAPGNEGRVFFYKYSTMTGWSNSGIIQPPPGASGFAASISWRDENLLKVTSPEESNPGVNFKGRARVYRYREPLPVIHNILPNTTPANQPIRIEHNGFTDNQVELRRIDLASSNFVPVDSAGPGYIYISPNLPNGTYTVVLFNQSAGSNVPLRRHYEYINIVQAGGMFRSTPIEAANLDYTTPSPFNSRIELGYMHGAFVNTPALFNSGLSSGPQEIRNPDGTINLQTSTSGFRFASTSDAFTRVPNGMPNSTNTFALGDLNRSGAVNVVAGGDALYYLDDPNSRQGNNQFAQDPFLTTLITDDVGSIRDIKLADMNDSGSLDVVFADAERDDIAIFDNTLGVVSPDRQLVSGTATGVLSVEAFDINGNGSNDIAAAITGDNTIAWFENPQDNSDNWTKHIISNQADGVSKIVAADINRNGKLDIVAAVTGRNEVIWYENLGNGSFSDGRVIYDEAWSTPYVAVADFSGNGYDDVAVVSRSSANHTGQKLVWIPNTGNTAPNERLFGEAIHIHKTGGSQPAFSSVYPYNHTLSPNMDIAVLTSEGVIQVYQNRFDNQRLQSPAQTMFSPGDVLPVPVSNMGNSTANISVELNTSATSSGGVSVPVDSLVSGTLYNTISSSTPPGVYFVRIQRNNTVLVLPEVVTITSSGGLFDNPEQLSTTEADQLYWIDLNKNGTYDRIIVTSSGELLIQRDGADITLATGVSSEVLFRDVQNSQFPDIIFLSDNNTRLKWIENLNYLPGVQEQDAYSRPNEISAGIAEFGAFTAGDLTGNGLTDFVVTAATGNSAIWLQQQELTQLFTEQTFTAPLSENIRKVLVSDLNLDGRNDLVFAGISSIGWIENNGGDSPLSGGQVLLTGLNNAEKLSAADLTGNRYPDLLLREAGSGHLKWFTNDGFAAFTPGGTLEGTEASTVIQTFGTADLSGNGRLDVVAAGESSLFYFIYNPADSTYFPPQQIAETQSAQQIAFGHLTRNGFVDVIWRQSDGIFGAQNTLGSGPSLTTPEQNLSGAELSQNFGWSETDFASLYQLEIATDSNFTTLVADTTLPAATAIEEVLGLEYFSSYHWRVRGIFERADGLLPMLWSESRSFTTKLMAGGGIEENPWQITSLADLDRVRFDREAYFILSEDIDLSSATREADGEFWNDGAGWEPLGTGSNRFTGTFDGNNHEITGVRIHRPETGYMGFLGAVSNATIKNLRLTNVTITGSRDVGGLAGELNNVIVENVHVSGSVTATATWDSGGITGRMIEGSSILKSSTNVQVQGGNSTGGISGFVANGNSIDQSYALGNVTATGDYTGGLVGYNTGIISRSYALGNVSSSGNRVGGIIGYNLEAGTLEKSYAAGSISGNSETGGLIGLNQANVSESFWDAETSGLPDGNTDGQQGLSTAFMKDIHTFTNAGWDFENVWAIRSDSLASYPYLQNNMSETEPGVIQLPSLSYEIAGPNAGWRMIGAPGLFSRYSTLLDGLWTQGYPGASNSANGASNVFWYDESTREWKAPAHASDFIANESDDPTASLGKAILVYVYEDEEWPQSVQFNGFQTEGEIPVQLTSTVATPDDGNQGWHLISNPYPFPVDWRSIVANGLSDVLPVIFIYDANSFEGQGAYRVHYGFDIPSLPGTISHNGILPPFQGFWARTAEMDGTPGTITFKPEHQSDGDGQLYRNDESEQEETIHSIVFSVSDENSSAVTVLHLLQDEQAREELVLPPVNLNSPRLLWGFEAEPARPAVYQSVYSESGFEHQLEMELLVKETGTYQIEVSDFDIREDETMTLTDHQTGETIVLTPGQPYIFTHQRQEQTQGKGNGDKNESRKAGVSAGTTSGRGIISASENEPRPLELPFLQSQNDNQKDDSSPSSEMDKLRFTIGLTVGSFLSTEPITELPRQVTLNQNYPNPFNPTTTIQYGLPETTNIRLDVFNMLGQRVATLVNGEQTAGYHTAQFDGQRLASGIYIYRLQAGTNVLTRKMVLVK